MHEAPGATRVVADLLTYSYVHTLSVWSAWGATCSESDKMLWLVEAKEQGFDDHVTWKPYKTLGNHIAHGIDTSNLSRKSKEKAARLFRTFHEVAPRSGSSL